MAIGPKYLEFNGLFNPFTGTKKWRVTCGSCQHVWDEKVPVVERCSAVCPCCGEQNVWSYTRYMAMYEEHIND